RFEDSVSTNLHELYITNPTLSVFPNPISQAFSIDLEEGQDLELLELYNLQGQRLQQWSAPQSSYQVDSQLAPGTYLLTARTGTGIHTSTIQVVR
ncbi:MAG: T9SS type A sorting domain-containing protein, partial [Phaeodactylibacter sp.]|nr:T9SS type A sorting domain-containing protein [Phaeodactylibacter sp.]